MSGKSRAISLGKGATNDTLDGEKRTQRVSLYNGEGEAIDIVEDVQEALETPSAPTIHTTALMLCLLENILNELKIMNSHLGEVTDDEKTIDDIC